MQQPSLQFYQGFKRCGSFPLLSAPHSLFRIWTGLRRYEKIQGAPMWRWGDWIWLTGPSRLNLNSPQGLNINSIRVFDQIRDPEIPITLRPAHSPTFPSLHLRHSSFSNPSVLYLRHSSFSNSSIASPTSQLILQPLFRFSYVTGSSLTSPGEPPMLEIAITLRP